MRPDYLITSREYRPDIDGLRALAVLSVILFHAGFDLFSGGYIGVDIFFVISGFLITKNIFNDVENKRFTFSSFYIRRIRRLFPSVIVTLIATFLFAVLLFSPQHLERLGKSVIIASLSASNFLFWNEAGYFDTSAEYKPLLHLWSLAVEEQFYLVWPSVLVILLTIGKKWLTPVFLVICAAVSLYYTQKWLKTDHIGAFYLAPFRVSEFAIGAICVWLIKYQPKNKLLLEPWVAAGLIAVLYPVFSYSEKTVFPGVNALVPCIGTGFLIYSGTASYLGRILSNPVAVGIGIISYSAYLAHWPVIIFYKYWKGNPLELVEQITLVFISLIIAVVMYLYVEAPFRIKSIKSTQLRPAMFSLACGGLVLVPSLLGAHAWMNQGWKWRVPVEIRMLVADISREKANKFSIFKKKCKSEKEQCMEFSKAKLNIVVLGDSHGIDGFNALSLAYPEHNYILASEGGCPPFVDVSYMSKYNPHKIKCKKYNNYIFQEWEDLTKADLIVLSALFDGLSLARLKKTITHLRKKSDARIIVFGTAMVFNKDVPTLISDYGKMNGVEDHVMDFARIKLFDRDKELKSVRFGKRVKYVSKLEIFCPNDKCKIIINDRYDLMTYDRHHLGMGAVEYMAKDLKSRFSNIVSLAGG